MAIVKPVVIIDGCNAINLMSSFTGIAGANSISQSFQASCSKLISMIQNFSYQVSRRFIIVFDGYSPGGRNQNFGERVSVIFSGKKIADLVIEKMTFERNVKIIEVVTSDNEVANICRNHGARVIKVSEFEKQLELYGMQAECHFIKQKGGKINGPVNTLEDNLDEKSVEKLKRFSVMLQQKEMEVLAKKEAEAKAADEKKRKIKQDKSSAFKKSGVDSKTIINDDDASLFIEMFAGAKRIESKKYADDESGNKTGDKKNVKPGAKKTSGDKKNLEEKGAANVETFDWRKHIDESFEKFSKKR